MWSLVLFRFPKFSWHLFTSSIQTHHAFTTTVEKLNRYHRGGWRWPVQPSPIWECTKDLFSRGTVRQTDLEMMVMMDEIYSHGFLEIGCPCRATSGGTGASQQHREQRTGSKELHCGFHCKEQLRMGKQVQDGLIWMISVGSRTQGSLWVVCTCPAVSGAVGEWRGVWGPN